MAAYATAHGERIRQELLAAGVTPAGLLKFSIRYLPKVVKPDEHIKAVAYGRYSMGDGPNVWKWEQGVLAATDQRVLFVDRKPGFLHADAVEYDEVSGTEALKAWPFASVTLMTKIGPFNLRYVKIPHADKFVSYVESRRGAP